MSETRNERYHQRCRYYRRGGLALAGCLGLSLLLPGWIEWFLGAMGG